MIPIKREPKDVIMPELTELCYLCKEPTRMWHKRTNNPVCGNCCKEHKVSELPNRFKGEKVPKMQIALLEENNKLIAEFLGFPTKRNWWHHPDAGFRLGEIPSSLTNDMCKFHSDWNWLMPIKYKICKIESDSFCLDEFSISKHSCCIKALHTPYIKRDSSFISFYIVGDILNGKRLESIDIVYNCIIDFIKWYNQNK